MSMDVPADALAPETLRRVIEEFVTREGTDYGERIYSLDEKVAHVMGQLKRGEAVLTFDEATQTVGIRTTR